MAKMKLNIKVFDMEGAFEPTQFEQMISDYDTNVPKVNESFIQNKEVLTIFKHAAGSPRLSDITRDILNTINEIVELTADYFDSVNEWSDGVVSSMNTYLGQNGLTAASFRLDRTALDEIETNFQSGFVGIESYSDARTYVEGILAFLESLRAALESITSDVQSADNSLPEEVHAALEKAISTNNDAVLESFDKVINYLRENIEEFTNQLQGAIDDMAQAANGEVA